MQLKKKHAHTLVKHFSVGYAWWRLKKAMINVLLEHSRASFKYVMKLVWMAGWKKERKSTFKEAKRETKK